MSLFHVPWTWLRALRVIVGASNHGKTISNACVLRNCKTSAHWFGFI